MIRAAARIGPRSLALLALSALVVACTGPGTGAEATQRVTIDVFAAASLAQPFEEIAEQFEASHPGFDVALTFAGSADLAAQIAEGAPADVFASASEAHMDAVADHELEARTFFASNILTIVVPLGNPGAVSDFASLARPGLLLVTCASQVPCGAATAALAQLHGVRLDPVSEEASVTDVLGKVASGEADAGIVYTTDGARESLVESIAIARADEAPVRYAIASMDTGDAPSGAADFVAFVAGPAGRTILTEAGFGVG